MERTEKQQYHGQHLTLVATIHEHRMNPVVARARRIGGVLDEMLPPRIRAVHLAPAQAQQPGAVGADP